jgi:ribosomal-protein-alanine N-acetyltransferase
MHPKRERLAAQVRKFQPADLDRVLAIEEGSFGKDAWDGELFLSYFRKCPDLFLVATLGRRVAGYMITCARGGSAELASIAVDPRDRRRGLGKVMLDQTLRELHARRIRTWWLMVETDNLPAIEFYERYGFARMERVKRYYGARRDAWRMRFALASSQGHKSRPRNNASHNTARKCQ